MKTSSSYSALILFILWSGSAWAQPDPAGVFSRANAEYQKGNYAEAARIYAQALESGVESGPLYYNLGNACFKQKQLGEAIYYWEKSLQKSPRDREARENLELANLLIVDRLEIPQDPFPIRVLSGALKLLTVRQNGWLALLLFLAANVLFSVHLFTHNRFSSRALAVGLAAAALCVLLAASLAWKTYDRDFRKKGIVVEPASDVRSGPGLENITVFTIHEGLKVRVHGSSDGWRQISLPNGWTGWIRQSDLRIL